jgi:hypothetical protein
LLLVRCFGWSLAAGEQELEPETDSSRRAEDVRPHSSCTLVPAECGYLPDRLPEEFLVGPARVAHSATDEPRLEEQPGRHEREADAPMRGESAGCVEPSGGFSMGA